MDDIKAALAGLNQGVPVPLSAEEAAVAAAQGDLQAALRLAQTALECPDANYRASLCELIAQISHPGAAQVALFCLLGEFSKRPEAMELVLAQVSSPHWVPSQALPEASPAQDPAELSESFARSEREARTATLKKLVRDGQLDRALQLPLDSDDYQVLWPTLVSQPEVLAEYAPELPVSLLVSALQLAEVNQAWPRLAELLPADLELLGWLSPGRTHTLPPQPVAFERYGSEMPYYDGGDGTLESGPWRVSVDEMGCRVNESFEIQFDNARDNIDYKALAVHDRFFEGLSGGRHQANKACSLSLSADNRLALATLDGAVSLYDLPARQRAQRIFPVEQVSDQAQPVRLRFSAQGGWLAGVHHGQFFVWDGHTVRKLAEAPAGLRGLFFYSGQLWSLCRDGSVYRLDPEAGELHLELEGSGLPACLSPDGRCLALHRQGRVELHLLGPHGLRPLSHWEAPTPVRMHFAQEGQALVLRRAEPGKTALVEMVWRMGWATRSQLSGVEHPFLQELLMTLPGDL